MFEARVPFLMQANQRTAYLEEDMEREEERGRKERFGMHS